MSDLSLNPTIQDLQSYIAHIEKDRGFSDQTAMQKCLLLGEEVGELFKAVRKNSGIGVDPTSSATTVGEELADILSFVLAIANRFEIDIGVAFFNKERANNERTWVIDRQTL